MELWVKGATKSHRSPSIGYNKDPDTVLDIRCLLDTRLPMSSQMCIGQIETYDNDCNCRQRLLMEWHATALRWFKVVFW